MLFIVPASNQYIKSDINMCLYELGVLRISVTPKFRHVSRERREHRCISVHCVNILSMCIIFMRSCITLTQRLLGEVAWESPGSSKTLSQMRYGKHVVVQHVYEECTCTTVVHVHPSSILKRLCGTRTASSSISKADDQRFHICASYILWMPDLGVYLVGGGGGGGSRWLNISKVAEAEFQRNKIHRMC